MIAHLKSTREGTLAQRETVAVERIEVTLAPGICQSLHMKVVAGRKTANGKLILS